MGCTNSKEFSRDKNGYASPRRHNITIYPRYHLEAGRLDRESNDVVAKKTATLGCNPEDTIVEVIRQGLGTISLQEQFALEQFDYDAESEKQFDNGLSETRTSLDERSTNVETKTSIRTSFGKPEIINIWELMEGLDDSSPFFKHICQSKSSSFDMNFSDAEPLNVSFPVDDTEFIFGDSVRNTHETSDLSQKEFFHSSDKNFPNGLENVFSCTKYKDGKCSPEKLESLLMSPGENDSLPEFDPEIISMFRKPLDDLSLEKQFYIPKATPTSWQDDETCQALPVNNTFQSSKKDRVVLYFTSLRGIRKTYDDCCHVRVIFKGLKARVDEKDLSMHSGYKEELKELMGENYTGGLPKVFIGKKYIGGADEIRRLHEEGELEKLIENCEMVDINGNTGNNSCEACGDIRFIPCVTCSGSCKMFYDYEDDEERTKDFGDDGFGFHRCPDCNENGLIRCPLCIE